MCFAALCACRVARVVFGAFDDRAGVGDISSLPQHYREFAPVLLGGCYEKRSYDLVRQFANSTDVTWPLQYYRVPSNSKRSHSN